MPTDSPQVPQTTNDFTYQDGRLALTTLPGLEEATFGGHTSIPVVTVSPTGRVTAISAVEAGFEPSSPALTALSTLTSGLVARTPTGVAGRTLKAVGGGVTVTSGSGLDGDPTLHLNDTSANVPGHLVARDAAGCFEATTITATLNGVALANVLKTGDTLTGSLSFQAGGVEWAGLPGFHLGPDAGRGTPGLSLSPTTLIDLTSTGDLRLTAGTTLTLSPTSLTVGGFHLSTTEPEPTTAWLSTPAYGTQGDGRTHLGYRTGSTTGNFLRGAFTTIDGDLTATGPATFSGVATFFANPIVTSSAPSLVLRDTGAVATTLSGWLSLQDAGGGERGSIGFKASADLTVTTTSGAVILSPGGSPRLRVTSAGALTLTGTSTSGLSPSPTHGSFSVRGQAGGFQGFQFGETPGTVTLVARTADGVTGVLQSDTWQWCYDPAQRNLLVNGTSPVWHTGNLTPATTPTPSTVAKRDAQGYLFAAYLNQSSSNGEVGSSGISQVLVTNGSDGFLRKAAISEVAAAVAAQDTIASLIAAVKALQAEVEDLKTRISER